MPYRVLDPTIAAAAPATTAGAPLTSSGETLLSFRSELIEELQAKTDMTPSRLDKWINKAYRQTAAMLDLKELWASVGLSLVASQPFYLIPPSVAWIKRVSVADTTSYVMDGGRPLDMIEEATYRGLPDDSIEVQLSYGFPRAYFRYGRMVVFWPYPGGTLTAPMEFRVRPLDLVNDTDSPLLPSEFHETIMLYAKARALRGTGAEYGEVQAATNDAVSSLRPLLNTDAEENEAREISLAPVRSHSSVYRRRY